MYFSIVDKYTKSAEDECVSELHFTVSYQLKNQNIQINSFSVVFLYFSVWVVR